MVIKKTPNGTERVYVKDFSYPTSNLLLDYPFVDARGRGKWLLGIFPQFHTRLFPDSILNNEPRFLIEDVSFTNSIHKIYIGHMLDMKRIRTGDCLVIYRCQAPGSQQSAWFKSVATSVCVVEEVRAKRSFHDIYEYVDYCEACSVFGYDELVAKYNEPKRSELYTIKMTYNLAFPRRPNLSTLYDEGVLPMPGPGVYYGLMPLSDNKFKRIVELGNVSEGFVVC